MTILYGHPFCLVANGDTRIAKVNRGDVACPRILYLREYDEVPSVVFVDVFVFSPRILFFFIKFRYAAQVLNADLFNTPGIFVFVNRSTAIFAFYRIAHWCVDCYAIAIYGGYGAVEVKIVGSWSPLPNVGMSHFDAVHADGCDPLCRAGTMYDDRIADCKIRCVFYRKYFRAYGDIVIYNFLSRVFYFSRSASPSFKFDQCALSCSGCDQYCAVFTRALTAEYDATCSYLQGSANPIFSALE